MWFSDLFLFFFPQFCLVCKHKPAGSHGILCLECEYKLPRTGFRDLPENPVNQNFWGRAPVSLATSLFRFEKGSAYQSLLHDLKYRGNRRAGIFLGQLLGKELLHSSFHECELLVPVPLHPRRQRERGYNQSEMIAKGMSSIMGLPVAGGILERSGKHRSQTSLGRYDRYENVRNDFRISRGAEDINGKKLLLVDDVVTTGATLEACSIEIMKSFSCAIYAATVCCA